MPEVQYVQNEQGQAIAYMAIGSGKRDIVYVSNWTSNVEIFWETKPFGRLIRRLSTLGRVIVFDQPGTGLSDPIGLQQLPTMEKWMNDLRAVLEATGSERPVLYAHDSAASLALMFAATFPQKVTSIVLVNAFARMLSGEDYPFGPPYERREEFLERWLSVWGTGKQLALTAPSVANDPQECAEMGRAERHSASPGVARALFRMLMELDVRHVLPAIHVPTLVLQTSGDRWIRADNGKYLAEQIEGAEYVEIPGEDHWIFYGDMEPYMAHIERFIAPNEPTPQPIERTLLSLVFTDIVDSTNQLARIGDTRWKELLSAHDNAIRLQIDRFRGREIETAGDSFLVAFDGPARAVKFARACCEGIGELGLELRTGVHAGECEHRGEQLGGIAVHIAARVMSMAGAGETLVSSTIKELVAGSGLKFSDRGESTLKGAGTWRLFVLER